MITQPPEELFERVDETDDALFYREPRLVTHIDDATIAALTRYYRQVLPEGGTVLDLMSSWVSHLPDDVAFDTVAGLGMNRQELQANPRLTEHVVHDLNRDPAVPFADSRFDAVLIAVSVQYLTDPVAVFADLHRVLRKGGTLFIATSHRCFPTKAIRAFHELGAADRIRFLMALLTRAGFEQVEFVDRSPPEADPLWIVAAT